MNETSEVREFYDRFSDRVLVRDFYYLNRRHEAVKELCRRFVAQGSRVLEIGCGVGIITKALSKIASDIVAVDISPRNIDIAKEFNSGSVIRFEVDDVTDDQTMLGDFGSFDAIVMADVIEHIPMSSYKDLFQRFESVLSNHGMVVLTFPSPEIQEYMRSTQPGDVQVIDEAIELSDLLGVTSLKPLYFSYQSILGKNDYVHFVLSVTRPFAHAGREITGLKWVQNRIRKYRWRLSNLGFLRRLRRKKITS